jgi:hypothetical protein
MAVFAARKHVGNLPLNLLVIALELITPIAASTSAEGYGETACLAVMPQASLI